MSRLRVVYDGECPFCSAYVKLARLREGHSVELVNAREHPETAGSYGLDLNEGMIVDHGGVVYHGADAIWMLSLLSSRSGAFNRLMSSVFARRGLARAVYPAMRAGRNLTLRALGRPPIK